MDDSLTLLVCGGERMKMDESEGVGRTYISKLSF